MKTTSLSANDKLSPGLQHITVYTILDTELPSNSLLISNYGFTDQFQKNRVSRQALVYGMLVPVRRIEDKQRQQDDPRIMSY